MMQSGNAGISYRFDRALQGAKRSSYNNPVSARLVVDEVTFR
jgi:hypothetical protein